MSASTLAARLAIADSSGARSARRISPPIRPRYTGVQDGNNRSRSGERMANPHAPPVPLMTTSAATGDKRRPIASGAASLDHEPISVTGRKESKSVAMPAVRHRSESGR